ncbi:hypothetical protein M407DRAFT_176267 [Tulasnella calospora MUT 4182]|uniref:Uncharacterized protein n=1 Tax=Tulasnella calospora MUT 4182 TaxID=1051891 RepID=A0A0C3PR55_9AGAM|nr:hypothetical protein M407DRAFT_176267 [Tulasnella calospora MUT 4182]
MGVPLTSPLRYLSRMFKTFSVYRQYDVRTYLSDIEISKRRPLRPVHQHPRTPRQGQRPLDNLPFYN